MPDTHKEKNLRACTTCKLIMSDSQWQKRERKKGITFLCPNQAVMPHHEMRTTPYFTGLVSIFKPGQSWVGRFNGLEGLLPGIYAVHILKDTDEVYEEDYKSTRNKKKKGQEKKREFDEESFEGLDEYEL
uniref:Spt4/RpoE2 zinc finger domain-containing protein n=1 Tax=Strombidium inclinatum TaxID=197538 RepID=A0A7S3IG77_9SPIT|mmetsp:Transcript_17213/g.26585  ORF Transcript_17213/g.26585 Transcript_17213/m.26585 type:complete len:130 (+) Transcript_17213:111-500(+)